jgi:hypothetical protein
MNHAEFVYQGKELDVFAHAKTWKNYWQASIQRWVRGDVLEVGAGLGTNTVSLQNCHVHTWHCLEPDPQLARTLAKQVSSISCCSVSIGTIADCAEDRYDTILYADVLEHIECDRVELAVAAQLLRFNGHLIVLSPAHQFLYSAFDVAIGHHRRYDKASLRLCSPPGCELEAIFYLDVAGMLASVANRLWLSRSTPTRRQIQFWDRCLIPVSRVLDPLLGHRLGKSIVAIWGLK